MVAMRSRIIHQSVVFNNTSLVLSVMGDLRQGMTGDTKTTAYIHDGWCFAG